MDLDLSHFTAKQRHSIRTSNARLNIWHGAVRSTKSTMSILRWLKHIDASPPEHPFAVIGKTQRTAEDNVIEPMRALVGRDLTWNIGRARGKLWGRTIRLYGANDERAEEKIRGPTFGGAYCDEITTWPKNYFARVLERLSVEWAKLFGTTNPASPMHWFKKDYLDRQADLDLIAFHFVLEDNPWLPEAFIRALKAEHVIGSLMYRRYILGEWVMAEGAIFDMWDESLHVLKGPMPERRDIARSWGAIDYGTVNPFVALGLHHVTTERDRIVVAPEWRHDSVRKLRQMTDGEYVNALMKWGGELPLVQGIDRWYVDPSAASFIRQMHLDGFRVGLANNDVIDGIRSTASLLAGDRLKIHESCEGLIEEIPGYVWDDAAQQKGEDKPLKIADHGPDALRYGVESERRVWRRWSLVSASLRAGVKT